MIKKLINKTKYRLKDLLLKREITIVRFPVNYQDDFLYKQNNIKPRNYNEIITITNRITRKKVAHSNNWLTLESVKSIVKLNPKIDIYEYNPPEYLNNYTDRTPKFNPLTPKPLDWRNFPFHINIENWRDRDENSIV